MRYEATMRMDLEDGDHVTLTLRAHGLLRIVIGFLFFQHGYGKLFGTLPGAVEASTPVPLVSLIGLSGLLEVFGGLLILLGLFTRPVAFVLAGEMVSAFLMAHLPKGGVPMQNGGELPLLYALVFLYFAGSGAGRLSVDAALFGPRHRL